MRKQLTWLAAASLAVGGVGILNTFAQDVGQRPAGQEQPLVQGRQLQLPPGIQKTDADDADNIRSALGNVVDDALTKDGFDKFVGRFVEADRDRIGDYYDQNKDKFASLAGRIAQIQIDWEQKYGQKFDVNHEVVFGEQYRGFELVQGEIVNPALLTVWPLPNKQPGMNQQPGIDRPGQPHEQQPQIAGDRKLEEGSNVAIVSIPESHGLSALTISMVQEGAIMNRWYLDVPNNLTGQRLHDVLLNNLTNFGEGRQHWPDDVNEAYRLVSHYVLMAAYDVPAPKLGEAGQQPGQPQPGQLPGVMQPGQPHEQPQQR